MKIMKKGTLLVIGAIFVSLIMFGAVQSIAGIGLGTTGAVEESVEEIDKEVQESRKNKDNGGDDFSSSVWNVTGGLYAIDNQNNLYGVGPPNNFVSYNFQGDLRWSVASPVDLSGLEFSLSPTGSLFVSTSEHKTPGDTALRVSSTGNILWTQKLPYQVEDVALDSDNNFYLSSENNNPSAIQKISSNGTLLWSDTYSISGSISLDSNGNIFFVETDDDVFDLAGDTTWITKLDPNGNILFRRPADTVPGGLNQGSGGGLILGSNKVYFGQDLGDTILLKAFGTDSTHKWTNRITSLDRLGFQFAVIDENSNLYVAADTGLLVSIDGTSGSIQWTKNVSTNDIYPTLIGDNDLIYVGTEDTAEGDIFAVNRSNQQKMTIFESDPMQSADSIILPIMLKKGFAFVSGNNSTTHKVSTSSQNLLNGAWPHWEYDNRSTRSKN